MSERIAKLEKMLQADPTDAFVLYALAQEHAKQGSTDLAVGFYDRCLGADPGYCYAYYHKARVLGEAGRGPEAIKAAKAGMALAKKLSDMKAMTEFATLLETLE